MKTKEELIEFEKWTIETFNAGKLRSPVHLSGGNEEQLINIFKNIKPQDWVFTTYRSHYHALLKGVPEQRLKDWILDNKSIHFMDKEYKVFSSAIVGGTLPIALGVTLAIKKNHEPPTVKQEDEPRKSLLLPAEHQGVGERAEVNIPHVYVFIGDMTAHTGVFHECMKYAINHKLPIKFIIENNGLSTDTKTNEVWGITEEQLENGFKTWKELYPEYIDTYKYVRHFPHYGTGRFIKSLWENKEDVRAKGF